MTGALPWKKVIFAGANCLAQLCDIGRHVADVAFDDSLALTRAAELA
jgi:hypothetical protein